MSERRAEKVIPKPDELNLEWFQAIIASGTMCLQQCSNCANYSHPPRYYCGECFSGEHSFVPISGAGTVYSYTISEFTAEEAWKDAVPYLTVVVQLDEGPRVVGSARIVDPFTVAIGQRVTVVSETRTDDFAYLAVVFDEPGATE
jgi:uncharacterized protein